MATFKVDSTAEEQEAVLTVLRMNKETIAASTVAALASIPISRCRYALIDLEDSGQIKRIPTKAFNKNYVRYRYEVLQPKNNS